MKFYIAFNNKQGLIMLKEGISVRVDVSLAEKLNARIKVLRAFSKAAKVRSTV